eukprot:226876-Alexandrium_andersonii.AAC.1
MGAAVPGRPMGQTALSAAPSRRKSETPIPQVQAQEAPREARCLLRLAFHRFGATERAGWPLGVLGPRPPRAGRWAPSSL